MTSKLELDECGSTLIELLITVMIMGIAFLAIMGGLVTAILGSDIQRKQAGAETLIRSYAEYIENQPYVPGCGATYGGGYVVPTEYSGYTVATTATYFWNQDNPATYTLNDSSCTAAMDHGAQRVSLQAKYTASETVRTVTVTMDVIKRCLSTNVATPPCPRTTL